MPVSASGARIQGDDYQHLYAWYHALRLLDLNAGVEAIEIEAEGAGNVDDVVVRKRGVPDEHYQVKYSVDASHPVTSAWFLTPPHRAPGGQSPLQRFWASFRSLKAKTGAPPHMALVTNRSLDTSDPLLKLRDGRHGRLMPKAEAAGPRAQARARTREWACHLGVTEDELFEMLSHLDLRTDQGAHSVLAEAVADRMARFSLRYDADAVACGAELARGWVTAGLRRVEASHLAQAVERKKLRTGPRRATLVVEAIERAPMTEEADSATARVDWVDLFAGDNPRTRWQLRDPSLWNTKLRDDLYAADNRVRGLGFDRVLVKGFMRLPLWFATGAQFAQTRGYQVACRQNGALWGSDVAPTALELCSRTVAGAGGDDLVLALSVKLELSADVDAYVRSAHVPAGRSVYVATPTLGDNALPDAGAAKGWAFGVINVVREAMRQGRVQRVHLFMAGPGGGALLLGHFWNRLPPTQLYEHAGGAEYEPTIALPG